MENPLDQQRLGEYQKRFAGWMGKQGLLFQLRHAGIVENESIVKQLTGLFARVIILGVALFGIGYLIINRNLSSDAYGERLSSEIQEALDLQSIEASGFSRNRGSGGFRDLDMEGGAKTFFFNARLENLTGPFDFLTGVNAKWKPTVLRASSGEIEIKAGGDDGEMDEAFSSIIESLDGKGLNTIRIEQLNCDWGYSKLTYGRIEGAQFKADLEDGSWVVELTGGQFQQNWLKGFDLVKARFSITKSGVIVHQLSLKKEKGKLELTGKITGPVGKPEFSLEGEFRKLPIEDLIEVPGVLTREYLSGMISGSLKITGSTDKLIKTEGVVQLQEGDFVTLRERWAVLRAISVLDVDRTYRRVDFTQGGFSFSTGNGDLVLEDINLQAGRHAQILGALSTHLPTQEEAAKRLGITLTNGFSGSFSTDLTDTSSARKMEDARMSLKRAAGGGKRVSDFEFSGGVSASAPKPGDSQLNSKELEALRLMEEMNVHRVTGNLKIAVPAAAFEQHEKLMNLYPADEDGWRWVEIDLDNTFTKISESAHDQLLGEARSR